MGKKFCKNFLFTTCPINPNNTVYLAVIYYVETRIEDVNDRQYEETGEMKNINIIGSAKPDELEEEIENSFIGMCLSSVQVFSEKAHKLERSRKLETHYTWLYMTQLRTWLYVLDIGQIITAISL